MECVDGTNLSEEEMETRTKSSPQSLWSGIKGRRGDLLLPPGESEDTETKGPYLSYIHTPIHE